MKRNAPSKKHARELFQRAIHLDHHTAFSRSNGGEFITIIRVVLNDSQSLHDERTQQLDFLFFSNWTMNAGRKNYRHVRRGDTGLHESAHEKIHDLRTRS